MKKTSWSAVLERLLFAIALLAALVFGAWVAQVAYEAKDRQETERAKRILERSCVHTGFYGRSGEQRVYSCHGWIVKEKDI